MGETGHPRASSGLIDQWAIRNTAISASLHLHSTLFNQTGCRTLLYNVLNDNRALILSGIWSCCNFDNVPRASCSHRRCACIACAYEEVRGYIRTTVIFSDWIVHPLLCNNVQERQIWAA